METEIVKIDSYGKYCVSKYKPFMFNLQIFIGDKDLERAKFVESYEVTDGQYEGCLYWG